MGFLALPLAWVIPKPASARKHVRLLRFSCSRRGKRAPQIADASRDDFASAAVAEACSRAARVSRHRMIMTSDGLTTAALEAEFRAMLGEHPERKHLWYVPTAAYGQGLKAGFAESQAADLQHKFGLGSVKVVDVAAFKHQALSQELSALPSVDAIYLEYGNTFYLRHHLRDSGADRLLQYYLDSGSVLVGSSAGAIVLGKTVQTAFWKNWDDRTAGGTISVDWDSPDLAAGLNILGGRSIFPHADGQYAAVSWQLEQEERYGHGDHEVVKLADGQGIVLNGPTARRVG